MARPSAIDAVLFDFDGVCADTEPFGIMLDKEVYAYYGIDPTPEEMESLAGTTGVESIPALFRHYGMDVSAEEFWTHRRPNVTIYRDLPIQVVPGIPELLACLRESGRKLALVSTTDSASINFALNRLGLASAFDIRICGDMVERHKPDPEPYLAGVAALGVDPTRCGAVEDSPTGIHAAKAAGLYTLGYAGYTLHQDTSEADETVGSFVGLAL